ncbi:cytochrome c biogenesis protein [Ktedonobacter sp. SOSP1-85]|uniref:carbohydrate ABC transporter permease n=1 Tax=Ktedonobacter sp. SOSP1-85 TaxID=2778367 RepID=UPI001915ED9D|nr:sugar ABC transporter permease [Ktedonobacter sp. SOSP1-85]GHO78938.1 cytochrome c biogenesis protein [Ktedonobacter sp. SOSP1-85]
MSATPVSIAEKVEKQQTVARKSSLRKYLPMYLSIAPFFIIYLCFGIAPVIFSLYLAFQRWDGIGQMNFIGLNNFAFALTDPIFGQAILNTFEIWIISTIPMLALALLLAFLLNMRKRSKFAYQVAYLLPNITSTVAIALIFGSFFGDQYGLINQMLGTMHLNTIGWLTDAWPMRWAVALITIWRWTGYNALIYMAGLQSIPSDFYEAARIDGANTWRTFYHITLPLLRPVILFTVISSTLGGMTLFTEPQILFGNNGGVGNSGLTMSLYQYWQAFASFHYGFGAAVGWIMFFILVIFTFVNWKIVQGTER